MSKSGSDTDNSLSILLLKASVAPAVVSFVAYKALMETYSKFLLRKEGPLNEEKGVLELTENFEKHFGESGSLKVVELAGSEDFTGGENKKRGFKGWEYSFPLVLYIMDRALGMNKRDAYVQFKEDVLRMFKHAPTEIFQEAVSNSKTDDIPMPSRHFIEKLCDPIVGAFRKEKRENAHCPNQSKQEGPLLQTS